MFNNKYKTIINIISVFILILLSYVYYKSEIVLSGKKNDEYFKYYIILFLFLIFNNTIFFLNNKIKLNYLVSLTSVTIILYSLEIFVSFNKKFFLSQLNIETNKIEFSPFEYFSKSKNLNIFPVVSPSNSLLKKNNKLFPLAGISNKETIFCNESDKIEYYFSDRYGFNNNDFVWDKKIEILLIGDSFTQGVCVNRKNNISSVISNKLNKNVLNLGYGGNGPLIEYATLKEYGSQYKPKKVIWLYFEGNDLEELFDEINNPILRKYYNKNFSQELLFRQKEIDDNIKNFLYSKVNKQNIKNDKQNKFIEILKFINLRNLFNFNRMFLKKDKFRKVITHFEKIISRSQNEIKKWDGELIFVYLPDYSRYTNKKNSKFKKDKILEIIKSYNIKLIDIDYLVFQESEDPLKYFPDRENNHYNKNGYKRIAQEIINKIY